MTLKQLFDLNRNRKWVFIVQGGNQGDSMIYQGAYKLADAAGLKYRKISMGRGSEVPKIKEDETIYVHGGGGWCTWWNWTPRLVNMLMKEYPENEVVIGPSTVALQDWYIDKWLPDSENLMFYAREQTTYNYLSDKGINTRLDHDTALHLRKGDKYLAPLLKGGPLKPFKLAAIREDPESPDALPKSFNPDDYDVVVDPCFKKNWGALHLYASEIFTNRSHSAILGAILRKPTKMFRGKYHKNRSIYDFSLSRMGVEWIE